MGCSLSMSAASISATSIPAPSTPCSDIRVIFRGEPVRPLPDIRVIFRGQVKQADHAWRRFRNSDFGQFFWDNDASTRSNLMGWGANAGMLIPGAGKVLGAGRALHWLGNTANRYRNALNLGQAGTAVARNVPRIGQAINDPMLQQCVWSNVDIQKVILS